MTAHSYPTLLLAGKRSAADPVALQAGVDCKALAPVAGRPMITHILDALKQSRFAGPVFISIEDPALITGHPALGGYDNIHVVQASTPSICRSIRKMAAEGGLKPPFLVVTADHALLTADMVDHFWKNAEALDADLAVGIVLKSLFEQHYPETRRTFIKARDDSFKSCNLFGFLTPDSLGILDFWVTVEQKRKNPWKLARAFGVLNLVSYLLRRYDIDALFARAGKIPGIRAAAIRMTTADAALDIDSLADLEQIEALLAARKTKDDAA